MKSRYMRLYFKDLFSPLCLNVKIGLTCIARDKKGIVKVKEFLGILGNFSRKHEIFIELYCLWFKC